MATRSHPWGFRLPVALHRWIAAWALASVSGLQAQPAVHTASTTTAATAAAPDSSIGSAQPEAASGRSPKAVVRAREFLAVTAHPLASEAAFTMLEAGGHAIDAAIAAQAVLALVEPQSSGLGGGGFLLHFDPATAQVQAYDGRETAPQSASGNRFLDATGRPLGFAAAVIGGRSVGVPGLIRMLELAHRDQGRLPWASLFEPAIRLANEGFDLTPRLHALLARERWLRDDPEAAALYYDAGGRPHPVGHRLRNSALADTLTAIARNGADALHHGPIARDLVERVRSHATRPGDLTENDLRHYQALRRTPLCTGYREWLLCGMPPPSAGGIAVAQILTLNDLAKRSAADRAPGGVTGTGNPFEDPSRVHRFTESARLAFADRDRWVADPAYASVPVAALLDSRYLRARAALIGPVSLDLAPPGDPERFLAQTEPRAAIETEVESTTHLSVIDGQGRTVALTSSIEHAFGARLMVRGFLLNNQLTDFSFVPHTSNGPVANRVEGGKRPRSSMAPTLVFNRNATAPTPQPVPGPEAEATAATRTTLEATGSAPVTVGGHSLRLAIGSPGGPAIINHVARTLVAVLDEGVALQQAIDAPNLGSRNGPTELEADTAAVALAGPLAARAHRIMITPMTSGIHGIMRTCTTLGDSCILESGTDPRREGLARGR